MGPARRDRWAKAFDEETIYRAAVPFERGVDWKSLRAG